MDAIDTIDNLEASRNYRFYWEYQPESYISSGLARDSYVKDVLALREILKRIARREARLQEKAFGNRTRRKLDQEVKDQLWGEEGMSDQEWAAIGRESMVNLQRWRDVWKGNPSRANFKSVLDAAAHLMSLQGAPDSEADALLEEMCTTLRRILNGAIALFRKNPNKTNARRVIRRAEEAISLGVDIDFMIDTLKKAASVTTRPRARARK